MWDLVTGTGLKVVTYLPTQLQYHLLLRTRSGLRWKEVQPRKVLKKRSTHGWQSLERIHGSYLHHKAHLGYCHTCSICPLYLPQKSVTGEMRGVPTRRILDKSFQNADSSREGKEKKGNSDNLKQNPRSAANKMKMALGLGHDWRDLYQHVTTRSLFLWSSVR